MTDFIAFLMVLLVLFVVYSIYMVIKEKKVTKNTFDNLDKTLPEYYKKDASTEDILEKSQSIIANHLGCSPKDIKKAYYMLLDELKFSESELQQLLKAKMVQKEQESVQLRISIELTPSAILWQLINDYNLSNIKNV